MVFVTVNCAPITAGKFVETIQVTGGVNLSVDCSVNPTAVVGQKWISLFPLDLELLSNYFVTPGE